MCFEWMKYSPGHGMIEKVLASLRMESLFQEEFLDKGTFGKSYQGRLFLL